MVTETYYSLQVNSWLKKYGINLDKLIKLWSEQQGRCRICGCEMKWCYLKEFKNGELREKERIRCKNSPITKKMNCGDLCLETEITNLWVLNEFLNTYTNSFSISWLVFQD